MKYTEAQEEARKLGLKYVGVSKHLLLKSIEQEKLKKQAMNVELTPSPIQEVLTPEVTPTPPVIEEDKKFNTAIVKNKSKQEIRRYTKEVHGERFAELANEFANDREYIVELVEVRKNFVCPQCGHTF